MPEGTLRAILRHRRPSWDPEKTSLTAINLAKVGALVLVFAGWWVSDAAPAYPFPLWFAFVALGGFVFFGARYQERRILIEAWEQRWVACAPSRRRRARDEQPDGLHPHPAEHQHHQHPGH